MAAYCVHQVYDCVTCELTTKSLRSALSPVLMSSVGLLFALLKYSPTCHSSKLFIAQCAQVHDTVR